MTPVGSASRCTGRPRTPGRTGSRSSASTPTKCARHGERGPRLAAQGKGEGHFHAPGAWPFGITAYAGREDNDLILWLPSITAIVTGHSLSDFGDGVDIQLGGRKHVTHDDVVRRLRPLLELPVELVLPAHGERTDRAALGRVLS